MSGHRTDIRNTEAITTVKEEARLSEWQKQIEERQSSGLSMKAWCKERGMSQSAYYHRLRKTEGRRVRTGRQAGVQGSIRPVLPCSYPCPCNCHRTDPESGHTLGRIFIRFVRWLRRQFFGWFLVRHRDRMRRVADQGVR